MLPKRASLLARCKEQEQSRGSYGDPGTREPPRDPPPIRVGAYAWYALFVLVIVYALNFIDRQILSILAEDIKRDLGLEDAQIGFLYGTAFAVFYALFGIPLGRLADSWYRGRVMAIGLALWSSMTALVRLRHQLRDARRRPDRSRSRRGRAPPRRLTR